MPDNLSRPPRRSTSGFSLVEALVVVVILGILTLIFAPRLEPITAGRAVNGARGSFVSLYNLARSYAVQLRGTAVVSVRNDIAVARVIYGGTSRYIGSAVRFDSTFRVSTTATPDSVLIQPTGLVTTGLPFTLTLSRSGVVDTVRVTGFGKIQ